MADFEATARSSYFKVRNREAFQKFCDKHDLELIKNDKSQVGFLVGTDHGTIPNGFTDHEGDFTEVNFLKELSKHLEKGWAAIVMEAGAEKMRYVGGWSFWVHWKGYVKRVSLSDIYDHADKQKAKFTDCEY